MYLTAWWQGNQGSARHTEFEYGHDTSPDGDGHSSNALFIAGVKKAQRLYPLFNLDGQGFNAQMLQQMLLTAFTPRACVRRRSGWWPSKVVAIGILIAAATAMLTTDLVTAGYTFVHYRLLRPDYRSTARIASANIITIEHQVHSVVFPCNVSQITSKQLKVCVSVGKGWPNRSLLTEPVTISRTRTRTRTKVFSSELRPHAVSSAVLIVCLVMGPHYVGCVAIGRVK